MAKGTPNLGELSGKVYELLQSLEGADRVKVLNSVHQLFGESAPGLPSGPGGHQSPPGGGQAQRQHDGQSTPQKFYTQKDPVTNGGSALNKGEMLAIAARYREQHSQGDHHNRDDFAAFFKDARVNFDKKNFVRDMKNAQRQAGLFNTGGDRGQYQLSYFGQQYVDALPDREAVKKIKRPARKKSGKIKAA